MQMELRKEDRSLGELFSDLSQEISTLVRQESELAKAEISQKMAKVMKSLVVLGLGLAFAYAGFLALIGAAIVGLWYVMPLWLSALVIGLAVLLIGAIFAFAGIRRMKKHSLVPEQTISTLKEDKQWLKEIK